MRAYLSYSTVTSDDALKAEDGSVSMRLVNIVAVLDGFRDEDGNVCGGRVGVDTERW